MLAVTPEMDAKLTEIVGAMYFDESSDRATRESKTSATTRL